MLFDVTARAFYRATGQPAAAQSRVERIDTATNRLFTKARTIVDVKAAYEAFWNDLNPDSEHVVFVSQVVRVEK